MYAGFVIWNAFNGSGSASASLTTGASTLSAKSRASI